jgi:hypothetical protein
VAVAEKILASPQFLFFETAILPRLRGATNRKTRPQTDIASGADGLSDFSLPRGDATFRN